VWGADFVLAVEAYPGEGRNKGSFYEDFVGLASGTRLSYPGHFGVREIREGFRTLESLQCLGCEFVEVEMTPQTNASDIERFNQIQFNCLTGWRSCKHPVDLAPALWAQALQEEQGQQLSEEQPCLLPTQILAREANDIAIVKVISVGSGRVNSIGAHRKLTVRILQPMKNGRSYRTTDTLEFSADPDALRAEDGRDRSPLVVGNEYFFLYRQPRPGEISTTPALWPCHALLNTPANAASIQQGIALDPSAGEPYDYRDAP